MAAALGIGACWYVPQPTAAQAPMVFDFEPTAEELAQTPLPNPPAPAKKVRQSKAAAKTKPAAKGGVEAAPIAPVPGLAVALPDAERERAASPATSKRAKPAAKVTLAAVEPDAEDDDADEATKSVRPKSNAKVASKPARKAAKRRGRQPTPAYQKLRDSWLAPVDPRLVPTLDVTGRVPLVLSQVNGGLIETLVPQRDDGGFTDADLERAAKVFAPRDMEGHPIAPRLLDLMYRAMRHFQVPMVHVVSGYRKDRAGSRHTQGRAVDMVLPGVSNDALAEYVRSFGYCGVGIYTNSGFVHLDVRDKSYFWVDHSLPGERSRSTPILVAEAIEADRTAAARGEAPDSYVPNNEREDRAATKAYARRAKLRRERAQRQLASAQTRAGGGSPAHGKAGKAKPGAVEASVFGGLPP